MSRCEKFDKIDEIVSEYITNSDYDAGDAMEDIIQVLVSREEVDRERLVEQIKS